MVNPADADADTDAALQPVTVTHAVRRRFESGDRMYAVMLQQDLFGDWVLLQAWGGKFNRLGGHKTVLVADVDAGLALMESVSRRRLQRGYVRVA